MRTFLKGLIASVFFGLSAFSSLSLAQAPATLYYQTYLNLDGNPAGCTVTVFDFSNAQQTLNGVDVTLLLTVTNGVLVSAERFACIGGALVSQGADPGHPTYTLGGAFIEYRIPNVAITPQTTVGFAASASPNFNPSDVFFESSPGQPISLAPLLRAGGGNVPIPVSTPILLLLIAIASGLIAARALRTPHGRRIGAAALIFCFASISGAVYSAAHIILDGTGHSWVGIPALATDPEGDALYPEIDLLKAYGFYQDNTLYLKLDLKKKPDSDTTPLQPAADFRLLGATVTEPDSQSQATASGTANQIRGIASQVRIKNIRTNETVTAPLNSNTWQGQLTAQPKDVLELTPIAADQSEGGAIRLTVQGTATEPTLPPDPINDGIAPQLDPLLPYTLYDSTRFLYTNNPPVQTGVDPDTIKPKFASLLVGKTLDRNDQPLSGVTVKVKDHSQYGQTLTREDGQWDLVVNGGQWFTVEYSKDGFLTIQRKVQVAWQDYGYLPDVVLIPLDPKVSVIDLTDLDAPAFQIHQGTTSSDADGDRQATVLFPKGVTAQMQMPDGSTQNIDVLNVRATEYTIGANGPNAMPGELPPATGYTYAVELSVDQAMEAGAIHVNFSEPLPLYVDNFLNFPVGEIVPLGWYDYDLKAWVPDENGYVIEVLNINNGSAVLDVKGNGTSATQTELDNLGITNEELKAIAQLYAIGKTFWRNRITHFTPWDCNLAAGAQPCGAGEACDPPEEEGEEKDEEPQPDPKEDPCVDGCVIRTGNRSIGESVNASGTPFALHYESRRFKSPPFVKNTTDRRLRDGRPFPVGLINVEAKVNFLGRSISTLSRLANQVGLNDTSAYSWDGKDRYGRAITSGVFEAQHTVTYVHQGVYLQSVAAAQSSFGQYSGTLTALSSRGALVFGSSNTVRHYLTPSERADSLLMKTANLGRWTLSVHHHYDPVSHVLAMGDGMDRTTQSITPQLKKIRSFGSSFYPLDVEPLPDGSLLYLVYYPSLRTIERVSEDGANTEILVAVSSSDDLWAPTLIRYDVFGGGIYIITTRASYYQIYYRYPSGQIEWVAGKERPLFEGYSGNNVFDPKQLQFGSINDMAVGRDGSLYIVDGVARCVRKIDTFHHVATVAGSCDGGTYSTPFNEGASSVSGNNWYPYSIAMNASGQLYIGAYVNKRSSDNTWAFSGCSLQKIDAAGRMFTVAGDFEKPGCSQESNETAPDKATFSYPQAVATGYRNDVYFATDSFVRHLANNRLSLLLGNSETLGDGTPSHEPVDGQFNALNILIKASPMKVDAGGTIYFKSAAGHIFMMKDGLPGFDGEEHLIPSSDGKEIYRFSAHGRHLETLDALTGAMIYRFGYGVGGLETITDHDGNETRIERNGGQIVIVGPYGHRTEIGVSNSNATSIKNPADETWQFSYDTNGLMRSATTPRGQTSNYEWDAKNRLLSDRWSNGGGWTIASALTEEIWSITNHKVSMTSGEGRTSHFETRNKTVSWWNKPPTTQTLESTVTAPDGLVTRTENPNLTTTLTTHPDGTRTDRSVAGDSRFGVFSPFNSNFTRIGKKDATGYQELDIWRMLRSTETTGGALVPVTSWTETVWQGLDLSQTTEYRHADHRWRIETPSGKETLIDVDLIHRPLKVQRAGEPTSAFAYDSRGRMDAMTQTGADGTGTRQWRYSYDAQGNLAQITDPLNRTNNFGYDAVGRVTKQTLPDGREVATKYDKQGNLEELTTPSGDIHRYAYGAMEDVDSYTPPTIGGSTVTTYQYDKDRKLTSITLPNASAIGMEYGQTTGRLQRITSAEPDKVPSYDTGGRLTGWAQGSNALAYSYGSLYPEGVNWLGDVKGKVTSHREVKNEIYDPRYGSVSLNKGWLSGISVIDGANLQKQQSFKYDADGILTEVELNPTDDYYDESRQYIRLDRDDATGRLKHLYGWKSADHDKRLYDAFGELTGYRYYRAAKVLDNVQVALTGNETSVDFLKVGGALTLDGGFTGLDKLWLVAERINGEDLFASQWFQIDSDGVIADRILGLEGTPGVARDLTISADKAGLSWSRTVGKITKQARTSSPVSQFTAIETGASPKLYALDSSYRNELLGDYYRITRLNPATAQFEQFDAQMQPLEDQYGKIVDAELIGAYSGQAYLYHRGTWDCGKDENDQPYDCVTEQKEGQAEFLFSLPGGRLVDGQDYGDFSCFETYGLRHIADTDRQFYMVRGIGVLPPPPPPPPIPIIPGSMPITKKLKETCESRFEIEHWDGAGSKQLVTTIAKDLGEYIVHLASAGSDLLIYTGSRLLRINADGSYREMPIEAESGVIVLSVFGDAENSCYTLRKEQDYDNPLPDEYVCKNLNGEETNRSVLPPRSQPEWRILHNPLMNPPTKKVYIVLPTYSPDYWNQDYTLWHLTNPASRDSGLWMTVFEEEPIKMATLTISGSLDGVAGYQIDVERDALGRVTKKAETLDDIATVQNYGYDIAGRLIGVTGDANETWGYDTNGNRTHRNGSPIATFDAQDRILTQGSVSYSYNALGQRTEKNQLGQITRYSYDVFGGLKQVTLSNGTTIDYAQDPLGRRIGRKEDGTWTNKWLYKDQLNPIAELDGNDRIRKFFIYADKAHVPAYMITYKENGDEDKQYRIVSDLLGSVRAVYDLETGDEVQRMDYDVWGNVVNDTNPGFQPFGFAGGLYDSQTKLTRFGARDYDAETGRWTAKDPIGFKGGDTNLYGYVFNDPVNWIDPMGLLRNPFDIFDDASNGAGSAFPDLSGHNDASDAYRHCLASCMMTVENSRAVSATLGWAWEQLGDFKGQEKGERKMDDHNNSCGNKLGSGLDKASDCPQACMGSMLRGELITSYKPGSTKPSYGPGSGPGYFY